MATPWKDSISRRKLLARSGAALPLAAAASGLPAFESSALAKTIGTEDVGAGFVLFHQTNLTSDQPGVANNQDARLVNAWGIALSSTSPFWISDNQTGVSTLYNGAGQPFPRPPAQPLVVTIPPPSVTPNATAAPTGVVFNGTGQFVVKKGKASGSSAFIFSTEDGTISGWNRTVDPNNAILEVDNLNPDTGSVYKGLAIGSVGSANYLYASNFRLGKIDVFDSTFMPATLTGSFSDPTIPSGFAPFNVQNLGGTLYVTYAKQDDKKHDDIKGLGNGIVNAFTTDGVLVRRIASGFVLDSPWGLAIAPPSFGSLGGALLVGNFGNGWISAFDPANGAFKGLLIADDHRPVQIDGLWGLAVGNGVNGGRTDTLYFTAGPNGESDGLFGSLSPVPLVPNV